MDSLISKTYEGLDIKPLYTAVDRPPDLPGTEAIGGRRWETCCAIDLREAEQAVVESARSLAQGADSLWLKIDRRSSNWDRITLGVMTRLLEVADGAPIYLDGRGVAPALAALTAGAAQRLGVEGARIRGGVDFDPLGTLAADGTLAWSLEASFDLMVELARWADEQAPNMRSIAVSTVPYVNAGATAVDELTYTIATGVEYLRQLERGGLPLESCSRQIRFVTAVGRDFFMEIAKLRSMRILWRRVIEACGIDGIPSDPPIHALTSPRCLTGRDPWVNLLRGTNESFAAIVGGADIVTVLPFDSAVGRSDESANRIALNTSHILKEECHLDRVADPASGSYFVDSLTRDLATASWQKFQAIESAGGMSSYLRSGAVARELAETLARRRQAISTVREPITGVSTYANLEEKSLPRKKEKTAARPMPDDEATGVYRAVAAEDATFAAAIGAAAGGLALPELIEILPGHMQPERLSPLVTERDSRPFEILRDLAEQHLQRVGTRPRVFVAAFGPSREHRAAANLVQNLLAAGGIATAFAEAIDDSATAVAAYSASGSSSAIICVAPERAGEYVPELARALKDRGARRVLLAAPPGARDPEWQSAGVDGLIYKGCDAVKLLGELLEIEGVQRG